MGTRRPGGGTVKYSFVPIIPLARGSIHGSHILVGVGSSGALPFTAGPCRRTGLDSRATTQQVQQTVDRAIGYLQTESAAWLNTRKCAACHHVPMPLWALSEAERQGYAIDKKFVADTTESLLGSKDKLMASKIFPNPADPPDPRPQGRGLNMGLPFLAVAAQSLPSLKEGQKQSLKLIAEEIVKKQQPDGSWGWFWTRIRSRIGRRTILVNGSLGWHGGGMSDSGLPAVRQCFSRLVAWRCPRLHIRCRREGKRGQNRVLLLASHANAVGRRFLCGFKWGDHPGR